MYCSWYVSVFENGGKKGSISAYHIHGLLVSASPFIAHIFVLGKTENGIMSCKWQKWNCVRKWVGASEEGEKIDGV